MSPQTKSDRRSAPAHRHGTRAIGWEWVAWELVDALTHAFNEAVKNIGVYVGQVRPRHPS